MVGESKMVPEPVEGPDIVEKVLCSIIPRNTHTLKCMSPQEMNNDTTIHVIPAHPGISETNQLKMSVIQFIIGLVQ